MAVPQLCDGFEWLAKVTCPFSPASPSCTLVGIQHVTEQLLVLLQKGIPQMLGWDTASSTSPSRLFLSA